MSYSVGSSFPSENALIEAASGRGLQRSQDNALLMQRHQQEIGATDMEQVSRAALGLLSLSGEAERAAAYPGVVRSLQQQGFAKNAPLQYGGEAWLKQIAAMGVPASEQYKMQGSGAAVDAIAAGVGLGPGASVAPAARTGGGSNTRPEASGAPPAPGTPGAAVAQRTHDFWRSQGMTEEQTAGIMAGGPGSESDFRPDVLGDKDKAGNATSYGLYQHHGTRWEMLKQRYGPNPTEQQQHEFAAWEIGPNGPPGLAGIADKLRAAKTPAEAATIWTRDFGRPGDPTEVDRRARGASRYLGPYGQPSPYQVAGPPVARTGSPVATPTPVPGGQGLVRDPVTGNVGTPNAGGLGNAPTPVAAAPAPSPAAAAPTPAPLPPELQTDAHLLTERDKVELAALQDAARKGRITPAQFQNEVQQRQAFNEARKDKWQAQQHQGVTDARLAESHQLQVANLQLAQESHKLAVQKAQREADKANQPLTGDAVNIQHERLLNDLTPKMRDHTATEAEERLYSGSYYALQQSGGQATTMTDPNNPGSTIPATITRRLPPSFPEPPGGALPLVMASPGAAKREPMTDAQAISATYADRMKESHSLMNNLDAAAMDWAERRKDKAGNFFGYTLTSPDYQKVKAAQENFITAKLRKESGAVINPDEFERDRKTFFPQPGEDAETVALKRQFRETTIAGMEREAGPNYKSGPAATAAPAAPAPHVIRYDHQGNRVAQ